MMDFLRKEPLSNIIAIYMNFLTESREEKETKGNKISLFEY